MTIGSVCTDALTIAFTVLVLTIIMALVGCALGILVAFFVYLIRGGNE